jgi:diguanylate cyclase (GGDEF)-like protein/PAS domain S-box-containing protein
MIGGALFALILLVYLFAIHVTNLYRDKTTESQMDSLSILVASKTNDLIDRKVNQQRQFGIQLSNQQTFKSALAQNDFAGIKTWLSQYFIEQSNANPELNLKAVIVRGENGSLITQVGEANLINFGGCPEHIGIANNTLVSQARYTLCRFEGGLYSDAGVEANLSDSRYDIHTVIDVAEALKTLTRLISLPMRITNADGDDLFVSQDWPSDALDWYMKPEYQISSSDSTPGLNVAVAFDQQVFLDGLDRSNTITLAAISLGILILLACVSAILYFAFRPLKQFHNSEGRMLMGKYAKIDADRLPTELHELINAYNQTVENLEDEIISRRQFEEKLRSERDFISTTLNSIQNPVIVVNSRETIKLLNPAAELFLGDKQKALINMPLHELLVLYANWRNTRIVDLTQLIKQKQIWNTVFYLHPDQSVIELEVSSSPMIDLETEDIGYVIILKDVSEDRQLRRKLSYEGSHDQLTGFLNRSAFENKFETIVLESSSDSQQHVLAYLDIDQFKVVNETCGNTAGDQLIKQAGEFIRSNIRKSDIIARLSGDEFGIIMPFVERKQALDIMQKIIIDIQQKGFCWDDKEYRVTASIGVMLFGQIKDEYADYYSRITTACDMAKQNGGNQHLFVSDDDKHIDAQRESMGWVAGIMKGFSEDRFRLYVQPIVSMDLDDDGSSHYEVLIRYQQPDGEIILPGVFLPPAERYNLIEKVDCWVVSQIIDWLRMNKEESVDKRFSINLSGRSIGSETFHRFLEESLTNSEVDLDHLCFEITETAAVHNIKRSVEFITSIRHLGAKISLDDFGTGLSSFGYLKQFPVDYLKIDGEFIRDIIEDDRSFVFVRSMTELGHCLDMKVIAEFVESDPIIDRLRDANVDFIQGYQVGRPVSIDSLIDNRVA